MKAVHTTLIILSNVACLLGQDLQNIKKAKPFTISGSLSAGSSWNLSSSSTNPYKPNIYTINCAPTVTIYNVSLPFTIYYTNSSKGFTHPFNRYGVSPTWKWVKVHLGYRSLNLSPYVLSGRVFLGGGLELTPKKFRFAIIAGQLEKAQKEDTVTVNAPPPVYQRYGIGGKVGFGSVRAYVDLFFFKGHDVLRSIPTPVKSTVRPSENIAGGIAFSIPFSKRIVWQTNIGITLYTRDVYAVKYDSATNETIVKYVGNNFIPLNMSSQYLTGGESFVRYDGNKGSYTLKYKRVDPDYKTMGTFYQQSDISEYSALLNRKILKDKINVNANISRSEDNIYRLRTILTKRDRVAINVAYNPGPKWGTDVNLMLFRMFQTYIHQPLGDSLRIDQLNKMISAGGHYNIDKPIAMNTISLTIGNNTFSNNNPEYVYDFKTNNINFNGSFSTFFKRSKINLTEIAAYYINNLGTAKTTARTIGVSSGKSWLKDKLNTNLSINFTSSTFNGKAFGNSFNLQSGVSYRPDKNHTFGLNAGTQKNISPGRAAIWFTSINLRYTYTFSQVSSDKKL